jgi:PAS domain S-box-containing protein
MGQGAQLDGRRKNGEIFPVEVSISTLGAGDDMMFTAVVRDVTERTRAEQTRRATEERYRSLFSNMLNGFAYCRMLYDDHDRPVDFVYLSVNEAFARLTGLTNVVGKPVSEVIPGIRELSPELFETYGRVASTGIPETFEFDFKSQAQWLTISVYCPEKGSFIAVFDDITERKRVEAALRESEERYRIIAESVSDAIIAIDQDSRIIRFANTSIETILGYSPGELVGKDLTLLMPERSRDAHRVGLKRYVDTGVKHLDWRATEVIGQHKNGTEVPLEVAYGEYAKGATRYFVGVLRDVTALRRAEEGRRLFRALLDRSNDIIEVVDPNTGRFLDVNEKGCVDLGYSREEFLALSLVDIDPTLDPSSFSRASEELRESGMLLWEGLHRRKDGSTFPVEVSISLIRLEREYAVAVVRDTTERKRAEADLRLHSTALNAAANPMVITDRDGTIAWVNVAFTESTGYSAKEAIGKNPRALQRSGVHDREFYKQLWDTILSGKVWRGEITNRRKDGSLYSERQTITPVKNAQGEISHFISVKRDLTEDNKLQAQLLQAQKMESVGRLAGGVAHDFNNLLSVILGWTGMALEDLPAGHAVRPSLEEVLKAGEGAAGLTRQLLLFSRQQVVETTLFSVNDLVVEMDKMLRRLIGEDIELVTRTDPELGTAKMDRGQLEQVLMNLVVNARDAMPDGGKLTIETANVVLDAAYPRRDADVAPGEYVMVAVSDSGAGMSEGVKTSLFEPFFTTKAPGKGTAWGSRRATAS